jgi:type III secretory pathway component EscR
MSKGLKVVGSLALVLTAMVTIEVIVQKREQKKQAKKAAEMAKAYKEATASYKKWMKQTTTWAETVR